MPRAVPPASLRGNARTRSFHALPGLLTAVVLALGATSAPTTPAAALPAAEEALEPTAVTAAWPARKVVKVDSQVRVTGTVTGPARQVLLQHRGQHGWDTLAVGRSADTGGYTLTVPTSWFARHRLRVHAPATQVYAAGSSGTKIVRVRPRYTPQGAARQHRLMGYRWDGCQTIRYRINPQRRPKQARVKDVHRAVRTIARATGLTFRYAGTTKVVPFKGVGGGRRVPPRDPRADFVIGFATPRQVPLLAGPTIGLGGALWAATEGGVRQATYGFVVLDRTTRGIRRGWGRGQTWGELLLHEVAHAVGLDHVQAASQMMSSKLGRGRDVLGAGDLAGLAKVGRSAGCIPQAKQHSRGFTAGEQGA